MPPQFLLSPFNFLFSNKTLAEISREANDKFLDQLILTYGENHPTLFRGSFREACSTARDTSKVVMVCILSKNHQDTEKFCTQVLFNSDLVTEYVNEHFVLFVADVGTIEGYKLSQELIITTFPHISIVHPNGTIVSQIPGYRPELQLIQELTNLEQLPLFQSLQENQNAQFAAQNQLEIDRMLRQEQEEAYQESLAQDRERALMQEQQLQEEERKKREEEETRIEQERQENEKRNILEQKLQNLPPEPTSGEILSLAFRLPNGKRLQRKFAADNAVQVLYDFIDTNPDNPNENHLPYSLFSSFPKRHFVASEQTLKEAGVPNHTVLDLIYD